LHLITIKNGLAYDRLPCSCLLYYIPNRSLWVYGYIIYPVILKTTLVSDLGFWLTEKKPMFSWLINILIWIMKEPIYYRLKRCFVYNLESWMYPGLEPLYMNLVKYRRFIFCINLLLRILFKTMYLVFISENYNKSYSKSKLLQTST
jgi:hypothetical protein